MKRPVKTMVENPTVRYALVHVQCVLDHECVRLTASLNGSNKIRWEYIMRFKSKSDSENEHNIILMMELTLN